jgi:hypothetical protein
MRPSDASRSDDRRRRSLRSDEPEGRVDDALVHIYPARMIQPWDRPKCVGQPLNPRAALSRAANRSSCPGKSSGMSLAAALSSASASMARKSPLIASVRFEAAVLTSVSSLLMSIASLSSTYTNTLIPSLHLGPAVTTGVLVRSTSARVVRSTIRFSDDWSNTDGLVVT